MLPSPGYEPHVTPTSTGNGLVESLISSAATFAIATIAATPSATLRLGIDMPTAAEALATPYLSSPPVTQVHPMSNFIGHHAPPPTGECQLLGPFALVVQGALGLLAVSALVFKRWRERPQRPIKIWFFDASKQVVGSVLVHIANLLMSMLSSGQFTLTVDTAVVQSRSAGDDGGYSPNPCSFYLLNLAIDTTIGIPILIVLLRVLTGLFHMTPFGQPRESIQSGHYGSPPRAYWWYKQSVIYFLGLLGMKFCVLIIFLVLPWISRVGDWALRWTEGNERLQVFFVMLFFPVIMNATQYYIIDGFIKGRVEHELVDGSRGDGESYHSNDSGRFVDGESGSSEEIRTGDEDNLLPKSNSELDPKIDAYEKVAGKKGKSEVREYDPAVDGETESRDADNGSASERRK